MGQTLHWAECLMGIINSNLMCCDYIRCTNEDTGIIEMRDPGLKATSGGLCSLHVKLLVLLPPTVAMESIAS